MCGPGHSLEHMQSMQRSMEKRQWKQRLRERLQNISLSYFSAGDLPALYRIMKTNSGVSNEDLDRIEKKLSKINQGHVPDTVSPYDLGGVAKTIRRSKK